MKEYSRTTRIAEQLKRELSELIRRELDDPRVELLTVTEVEVTRDLAHAKVYVSTLSQKHSMEEALEVLQQAGGFLRSQLGKLLRLRTIPEMKFLHDAALARGDELTRLINEVSRQERDNPSE